MRLSKRHVALLKEIRYGNLSTDRWRDFVPLSIKGLVEIDDYENVFGMRRILTTETGKAVLATLHSSADEGERKT